ncbi:CUB and sushi domain-containing protein 3 [Astyanax mexicanus]|uniref:CUB and sushi domain-containing protein 3 n=1 Tax=Astyanax mexicanus TaxID=7994 RepID=UPI0020CB1D4A|nr:CUB and sushi domain-containing protein 3 [Astyanax mexicanus]
MAVVLWSSALLLLLSAQLTSLVVSQGPSKCGLPESYPDKRLDERYASQVEFEDGQRVAYKCAVGYTQTSGIRVSYCRNGQWEPPSMTCTKKRCGSAGEIDNGQYEQDGNSFGAKAYAKCNNGFVLRGESVRECLDSGWSGTIPTCEVASSYPEVSDSFLRVSDSSPPVSDSTPPVSDSTPPLSDSSSPVFVSSPPMSSRPVSRTFSAARRSTETALTCKLPKAHVIFNDTKPMYNPGEFLSASCNVGFQLSIKCEASGSWSAPPKCTVIKCPELMIPHSSKSRNWRRFNMTVKITCNDGFQLKGSENITCAANGSWAPAVPTCVSRSCDRFPHYPSAQPREEYLSMREFESGATVRFTCAYGYRSIGGSSSIRCENGRWTPLQMRCEKKRCGSAGEIQNGRFQYTGVSFGDTATAECDEGYILFGSGVRLCRGNGWSGRTPVCEIVYCPVPPEVPGAEMSEHIEEPVRFRHSVSYRCLSGFLIGARDIYCRENGTWSAPPPQCREISCPIPSVPFGSRASGFRPRYYPQHTVRITCNPGYKIQGSEWITCGTNGNWTPQLPKCVRKKRFMKDSAK